MAACGSLRSLFENPLPEKPKSFIESLTWNQSKPKKPIDPSSFTELFGELHFREKPDPSSDGCPRLDLSELDEKKRRSGDNPSSDPLLGAPKERPKNNGGFSPKSSESLQLCTEGLGSESSDDVEEDVGGGGDDWKSDHEKNKEDGSGHLSSYSDVRGSRGRGFPPPIPSIGRGGKPWVCFKSFREGGRFVLREIRIPTHEFLHASREDGRLKLHFVCPDMDIQEGEEEGQDEEEEEEEEHEEEVGMEATVQDQIQSY